MERCLVLAGMGMGKVAPNPLVGSVVVHDDKIIGEGWHKQYGQAHAEVNALDAVEDKSLLKESTLYVNLEPCSHHGKTPPCADLIIKLGVPRVVVGMKDPFNEVNGKGIAKMEAAGIEVITGMLEEECRKLNRRFITFHSKKRPYIILKWAESADGFIGRMSEKVRVSNDLARIMTHQWRSEEQAIMAGFNTLVNDDPLLNVRYWQGNDPLKITIDRNKKLPADLNFFKGDHIAFTVKDAEGDNSYVHINEGKDELQQVMDHLFHTGIQSVLVEGGTNLITSFLKHDLWDEARIFKSPLMMKDGVKAPSIDTSTFETQNVGDNTLITFRK